MKLHFGGMSLAVIASAAAVMHSAAVAEIVPVGGPLTGCSWGQAFCYESQDLQPVDFVAAVLITGGPFEAPTFRELSSDDWSVAYDSHEIGSIETDAKPVSELGFEIWFESEPTDRVSFVFAAWHPGEFAAFEAWELSWNPYADCAWIASPFPETLTEPDVQPIPVPAAVLLGTIGLGIVSATSTLLRLFQKR